MHGIIDGRRNEICNDCIKKNHKIPRKHYMSARVHVCVFRKKAIPASDIFRA